MIKSIYLNNSVLKIVNDSPLYVIGRLLNGDQSLKYTRFHTVLTKESEILPIPTDCLLEKCLQKEQVLSLNEKLNQQLKVKCHIDGHQL